MGKREVLTFVVELLTGSQPTVLFLSLMLPGNSCTQVAHWVIPQRNSPVEQGTFCRTSHKRVSQDRFAECWPTIGE